MATMYRETKGIFSRLIRKRFVQAITVATLLLTASVLPTLFVARAVDDLGLFELGPGAGTPTNIVGDGIADPGPDWSDPGGIFGLPLDPSGRPTATLPLGGVASAFIVDDLSLASLLDNTTFAGAGGSNKNFDVISALDEDTWHWDAGNIPKKDDLSNVYAYAAFDPGDDDVLGTPDDHLIVYVGFERIDESGSSHVDIELFQDDVTLIEDVDGACVSEDLDKHQGCHFTGERTENDTIASMDFGTGGSFGQLTIRKWDGTQYVVISGAMLVGQGCADATGDGVHDICGFNNGGNIDAGVWESFDDGGDPTDTLIANQFTEFGLDVTALVGDVCFTTIMGKTRSSGPSGQQFDSELKDFAGPAAFNICGASIAIKPDDVNGVGEPHTFNVTANKKFGPVVSPADDGTIVDVDLTPSGGASVTPISDDCSSPGTVNGFCTVTFTSPTAGFITGHASADIVVGPLTLHRETDGNAELGNSDDAVKEFRAGTIIWSKVDNFGSLLGGATFQVCRTHNAISVDGVQDHLENIPDVCISVTDNAGDDEDSTLGEFKINGHDLVLGRYTVHETAAPDGFEPSPLTVAFTIALGNETHTIPVSTFVNQRPVLKLTQFGYTNVPEEPFKSGVLSGSGTATYTVKLKNFGGATGSYSGTLTVSVTGAGGGTISCDSPGCVKAITGSMAPGGEDTFTLVLTYNDLANGAVVTAGLSAVTYSGGRTASGTPATITFQIQRN